MVWCGGMWARRCPQPNVPFLEKVRAWSNKTFVRCRCNGVVEQPVGTCKHMPQLKVDGWVCMGQRGLREGPPWDACGPGSERNPDGKIYRK